MTILPTCTKSNGTLFSSSDIKWVKNVKRDKGTDWANMEPSELPEFDLNFSLAKEASGSIVKIDEILLLFQKVDKMIGVPVHTYLTHLVTPVYGKPSRDDGNVNFPITRRVKVIARGLKNLPPFSSPDELNFFKPNRGAVHTIRQLKETLSLLKIQKIVWGKFGALFI